MYIFSANASTTYVYTHFCCISMCTWWVYSFGCLPSLPNTSTPHRCNTWPSQRSWISSWRRYLGELATHTRADGREDVLEPSHDPCRWPSFLVESRGHHFAVGLPITAGRLHLTGFIHLEVSSSLIFVSLNMRPDWHLMWDKAFFGFCSCGREFFVCRCHGFMLISWSRTTKK